MCVFFGFMLVGEAVVGLKQGVEKAHVPMHVASMCLGYGELQVHCMRSFVQKVTKLLVTKLLNIKPGR